MHSLDFSNAMRLEPEEIANFIMTTTNNLSSTEKENFINLVNSLEYSSKSIFISTPSSKKIPSIIVSLLFCTANPYTARTILMDMHINLLKKVCDIIDVSYDFLVPISTIEMKLIEAL
jgi:hypothetical protein